MLVPASRAHSLIADHAGRPVKERAFPKNLRPRPNCCDNAAGGPRARPRVIERNETRIALSQVKHVFLVCSALVLLALTPPPQPLRRYLSRARAQPAAAPAPSACWPAAAGLLGKVTEEAPCGDPAARLACPATRDPRARTALAGIPTNTLRGRPGRSARAGLECAQQ